MTSSSELNRELLSKLPVKVAMALIRANGRTIHITRGSDLCSIPDDFLIQQVNNFREKSRDELRKVFPYNPTD